MDFSYAGVKMIDKTEQILWRIGFMVAELGGIFSAVKHILRGTEEWDSRATRAFVKSEVADLIKQTHLFCEQFGIDFHECEVMGEERYDESLKMWQDKGDGPKWK